MKFLKAHSETSVSIADMIHKALTRSEPARPIGNLHASALTHPKGFCPREVVLSRKLDRLGYPQTIPAPLQMTFEEGKDKQARLNNDWLRPQMVGNWQCTACWNIQQFCKVPKMCKCGANDSVYREVVFYHPSGAQGSIDAIIDVGKPKLRLLEFKIMSVTEWEKLKMPLSEHRDRCRLYLELIRGSSHLHKDKIDLDRMSILYCLRGYGKQDEKKLITPFKEFIVHADVKIADQYLTMAGVVTASHKHEWGMIPEGICTDIFDKRGHTCAVCKECWSGKFPANLYWKSDVSTV